MLGRMKEKLEVRENKLTQSKKNGIENEKCSLKYTILFLQNSVSGEPIHSSALIQNSPGRINRRAIGDLTLEIVAVKIYQNLNSTPPRAIKLLFLRH